MLRAGQFDLVWVEKEMLPWVPSWFELGLFPASVPLVVDYDDALFHRYDQHSWPLVRRVLGEKIDAVMRRADLVLAGNDYLAGRARRAGARRVELLPTVVDVSRYAVSERTQGQLLTIGWIGSPSTARYLKLITSVLRDLVASRDVRVVAVGANADQLEGLPVEVRPWSEAGEVEEIQQFDIGIMPLPDEPFERGKCGYKLIQYMACGKPVVASPVGVNREIIEQGINGFLANSHEEWLTALVSLLEDAELRKKMGEAGRKHVEERYSTQQMAPRLASLLQSAVK
jgi:glycosyltransferase involved in cell wall biosynthesis